MKLYWEEDDSIENIIVNNRLNLEYAMSIFRMYHGNKAKTIAHIEQDLEQKEKDRQAYLNSPEHKRTRDNLNALFGMASMLSPYMDYDAMKKMESLMKDPYTMNPREFGQSIKHKKKK